MSKLFSKPKALLGITLVLCMILSMLPLGVLSASAAAWNGSDATAFTVGTGEEATPYEISTGAHLAYLAQQVNAGTTYSKTYFKLTSDIDLGGNKWTPIGNTSSTPFQGVLDGDNHAITGLYVEETGYEGFIGSAGNGATIKNLSIQGNVSATAAGSGTAAFVGFVTASSTLTISNCTFTGTVSSTATTTPTAVGAFVGYNWNSVVKLDNCTAVNATITDASGWAVGGLVGIAMSGTEVTITNSSFSGTVNGNRGTGGLVGAAYYGNSDSDISKVTITNSYSEGTINSDAISGGLVGMLYNREYSGRKINITITDSYSTATLKTDKASGGLIGANDGWQDYPGNYTVSISNSYFAGKAQYAILNSAMANAKVKTPMTVTLSNVYYIEGSYTAPACDFTSVSNFEDVSKEELANGTVLGLLNNGRTVWKQGKTHPVLKEVEPPLSALTVGGVTVDVNANPFAYGAGTVSNGSIEVVPTAAKTGATTVITAVDETGNTVAVDGGTVTLAEGTTTTITIAVTYKFVTTNYTVTVYRKPAPWNGSAATAFTVGDGTEGNPYQIATGAHLAYLAEQVNAGTTYSKTYFKLTKDIDLGKNEWTPIGNSSANSFQGILDGDEHTITNLYIDADVSYVGLFGYAAATIKNLTLEGNVKTSKPSAAGFVAYVPAGLSMTFNNCIFSGTVEGVHSSGDNVNVSAFVAYNWNSKITIENCAAVNTTITSTTTTASSRYEGTGGLVATVMSGTDVTIKNSFFSGTVDASQRGDGVGGLVGAVWYSNGSSDTTTVTITNSYSEGAVKAQRMAGGLVGYVRVPKGNAGRKINLTITDCYSTATVTANGNYSGLLGGNYGYNDCPSDVTVTIKNSFFAGSAKFAIMTKTDTDGTSVSNTLTNVYYLEGSATAESALVPTADRMKTAAAFADGTVQGLLNGSGNVWKQGKTHPVFVLEEAPLFALTINGVEVDLSKNPYSYDAGTVSTNNVTLKATAAKNGAKVLIAAVDEAGAAAAVESGTVTLAEGATTTITIAVINNLSLTSYTVTVYRKPAPWNGSDATAFTVGNGEEATPYEISTGAHLAYLAQQVNAGTTYSKTYFKLTSDIDLGGNKWTPIGNTSSTPFQGVLDGDNHAITGLSVGESEREGLIGTAGHGATIKNLSVEGNVNATAGTGTAGFVGYVAAAGTLTISDCTFKGTITSTSTAENAAAAAFVGYNWNSKIIIENCSAVATITASKRSVSGLVASAFSGTDVTITNSYFSGNITGERGVGGLVGGVYYGGGSTNATEITITNSYSEGTITASATSGGLVGYTNNQNNNNKPIKITITDCYSTMQLPQDKATSGLFGGNYAWEDFPSQVTVKITDSFFAGKAKFPIMNMATTTKDSNPMTVTLTNVYYVEGAATTETPTIGDLSPDLITAKTAGEFADGTVAGLLGSGWATSTAGHPVHSTFTATTNALKLIGTSIRTSGNRGMRFHFKVNETAQTSNLLESGVVLAKAENTANGLYIGSYKSKYLAAIKGSTTQFVREDVADADGVYDWFTALLTFSSDANNETPYNARAYAVYKDDNGQEIVIYSDAIDGEDGTYNTLYSVAQKALEVAEDTDYSEAELEYLNSIVSKKN